MGNQNLPSEQNERAERKFAEPRHTPGPWHVHDQRDLRTGLHMVLGPSKVVVAYTTLATDPATFVDAPNGEHNARLIAAAPDMLAALIAAKNRLEQQQSDGTTFEEVAATLDELRAAIAKATGEA